MLWYNWFLIHFLLSWFLYHSALWIFLFSSLLLIAIRWIPDLILIVKLGTVSLQMSYFIEEHVYLIFIIGLASLLGSTLQKTYKKLVYFDSGSNLEESISSISPFNPSFSWISIKPLRENYLFSSFIKILPLIFYIILLEFCFIKISSILWSLIINHIVLCGVFYSSFLIHQSLNRSKKLQLWTCHLSRRSYLHSFLICLVYFWILQFLFMECPVFSSQTSIRTWIIFIYIFLFLIWISTCYWILSSISNSKKKNSIGLMELSIVEKSPEFQVSQLNSFPHSSFLSSHYFPETFPSHKEYIKDINLPSQESMNKISPQVGSSPMSPKSNLEEFDLKLMELNHHFSDPYSDIKMPLRPPSSQTMGSSYYLPNVQRMNYPRQFRFLTSHSSSIRKHEKSLKSQG
jgi:hypothetical protein